MKLQKLEDSEGTSWFFFCPGCRHLHRFTENSTGGRPSWTFDNRDVDKPSFSPSLLIFSTHPQTGERRTLCHLFLKDGVLQFLGDCEHGLKNQHVPLADIPPEQVIGGSA